MNIFWQKQHNSLSFGKNLDKVIDSVSERYRTLKKELEKLNRRRHPKPSRYQQRKAHSFIESKFGTATTDEDFMVYFKELLGFPLDFW